MGAVFPQKEKKIRMPRPKRGSPGRGDGGAARPGVGAAGPPSAAPPLRARGSGRGTARAGLAPHAAGLGVPRLPARGCGRSLRARLAIGQSRSEGIRRRDWDPPLEAVAVVVAP